MPQPEGAELEARRRLDQAGIEYRVPIAAWTTACISAAPRILHIGQLHQGGTAIHILPGRGASHRAAGDQVRCPISLGCR
jgi:hypothetical protein